MYADIFNGYEFVVISLPAQAGIIRMNKYIGIIFYETLMPRIST